MTVTAPRSRLPEELITVSVAGMTCAACERRISKALALLPGVVSASASTRRGTASLVTAGATSRESIDAAILALGYGLGRPQWLSRDPRVWRSAGVTAVFVAVLVWAVGAGDLTGRVGDLSTGGLLIVLALGLAAGVSTCMAMVGGIVLAISASAACSVGRASTWPVNLAFQAGRIGGFGLLGVALGTLGGRAAMPQPLVAALMVAVAVAMLLVGVRLAQLSPRIAGWSPTIPAVIGDRLGLSGNIASRRTAGAAVAGAATFFLPCGFTQAVQLYAFSTRSPGTAGAVMATFAVGTAPALMALAGAPTLMKGTRKVPMLRALGIVVVGFAVINATSALSLAGVSLDLRASTPQNVSANVTRTLTDQTITSTQDGSGYHPGDTVVRAGLPTHWVITSTAPFSCAASISAPDLGVHGVLAVGRNVFELPKLAAGTYPYSCSMGMYNGRIIAIEAPAAVPIPAPTR